MELWIGTHSHPNANKELHGLLSSVICCRLNTEQTYDQLLQEDTVISLNWICWNMFPDAYMFSYLRTHFTSPYHQTPCVQYVYRCSDVCVNMFNEFFLSGSLQFCLTAVTTFDLRGAVCTHCWYEFSIPHLQKIDIFNIWGLQWGFDRRENDYDSHRWRVQQ